MDKTYLPDLISGLEQELLRLGYTKGSMTFYRRRWNQLMAYAEDRGECYYTEQLGMDFLKEFFGITQEDFSRTLPQAETQEIRVVRMVGDFQLHHAVLRRDGRLHAVIVRRAVRQQVKLLVVYAKLL